MPLIEAITTQRAIRRLRPDRVDDAIVLRLIELATKAPTGYNQQNWEFIVVRDPDIKAGFARANRQALGLYLDLARFLKRNDPPTLRAIKAGEWQRDHFEEIPVLIVACLRGPRTIFPPLLAANYYGSIFPSIQNLLLGARAAGLGASLMTMPLWSTRRTKKILQLPRNVKPCALVALGWPRGRYGPTRRKPVAQITHLDSYGNKVFNGLGYRAEPTTALPAACTHASSE
jgi:nitroreductase